MAITLSTNGYCELADVQARCVQLSIGASSKPTTTQVELFITDLFQQINAALLDGGYIVPVPQSGGSLASTGTIALQGAHTINGQGIRLVGAAGTLSGKVVSGDWFTVDGSTTRYMALGPAAVDDQGEIFVPIAPSLMDDHADGVAVLYTATLTAATVLRGLNADGAAAMTLRAVFGLEGGDESPEIEQYQNRYDKLLEQLRAHEFQLVGAEQRPSTRAGTVRLVRV